MYTLSKKILDTNTVLCIKRKNYNTQQFFNLSYCYSFKAVISHIGSSVEHTAVLFATKENIFFRERWSYTTWGYTAELMSYFNSE